MKKLITLMLMLVLSIGFAGIASAHVTVQPAEVPANSYQVFTVRVPSEKEAATNQLKVAIPDGVNISRVEPKQEWSYEFEKNADGKVISITWTASGAGIGATEFGEFRMQGKVAEDATELSWKAYQTYTDGETVEWTGAPDAEKPASVTAVTAATGDGHGDGHGAQAGTDTDSAAQEDGEGRDLLTFSFAVAAMIVSVIALGLSLRKRK
ncbi:YcnI family protein [Cohnella sp. GCM10027633]|uniref:YcnI family copper-binding membrane protein n=1 Tax=unclassified Cohnella TaxID=2636738 RepID=UPI00363B3304